MTNPRGNRRPTSPDMMLAKSREREALELRKAGATMMMPMRKPLRTIEMSLVRRTSRGPVRKRSMSPNDKVVTFS